MYRKYFPALQKYNKLIFCDNAGGSQLPYNVLNTTKKFLVNNYVQQNANNILSKKITNDFKNIYNITDIIFNRKSGKLVFGSSSSQLFYNLANSIDKNLVINKNIILPSFSHEACVTPFEKIFKNHDSHIKWWDIEENNDNLKINYNNLLNNIDDKTSLIVLPHVSNILGNVLDIKYLSTEIKKINKNTKIIVDGVAYLPHDIIDIHKLNVDFYAVSFYKFCGLRVSAMYIKNLCKINNQNHYIFDDNKYYNSEKKLEIGGWNFESASSILGFKNYFEKIINEDKNIKTNKFNRKNYKFIMQKINSYEKILTKKFYDNLKDNKEIRIIESKSHEKVPIFSIFFKNYKCYNVNLILNELGLICSNSTYYCDRLFDKLNLCKENGLLRISLMHYNSVDEVNKICNYINMFKKHNLNFLFEEYNCKPSNFLKDSFNYLDLDKYYNLERFRAFSLINIKNDKPKICGDLKFYQSLNYNKYNGNNIRDYKNLDSNILNDSSFKKYVKFFKDKVNLETKSEIEYIQVHQIRVNAYSDLTNLVPEGIHQDGFNMVAILVINRENIKGGINNIYDNSKKLIYNKMLNDGDMIILNDNNLYHDVTNICIEDKDNVGYRDVFIFTTIS